MNIFCQKSKKKEIRLIINRFSKIGKFCKMKFYKTYTEEYLNTIILFNCFNHKAISKSISNLLQLFNAR